MSLTFWKMLAALCTVTMLSNCAPLIGAGVAVGADAVAEDRGDNLF